MPREYEVTPRPVELGGGWDLKLLENGHEAGGGVFAIVQDEAAGVAWWNGLGELGRTQWLRRAGDNPTAAQAYVEHMTYEAHQDAIMEGNEWLESFRGDPNPLST
jgi:hypothetical protein